MWIKNITSKGLLGSLYNIRKWEINQQIFATEQFLNFSHVRIFVKIFWNGKFRAKILNDMNLCKFSIFTAISYLQPLIRQLLRVNKTCLCSSDSETCQRTSFLVNLAVVSFLPLAINFRFNQGYFDISLRMDHISFLWNWQNITEKSTQNIEKVLRNCIPVFQIQHFLVASTLLHDAAFFFSFPVTASMYMVIVLKFRTPIALTLSSMLLENYPKLSKFKLQKLQYCRLFISLKLRFWNQVFFWESRTWNICTFPKIIWSWKVLIGIRCATTNASA